MIDAGTEGKHLSSPKFPFSFTNFSRERVAQEVLNKALVNFEGLINTPFTHYFSPAH